MDVHCSCGCALFSMRYSTVLAYGSCLFDFGACALAQAVPLLCHILLILQFTMARRLLIVCTESRWAWLMAKPQGERAAIVNRILIKRQMREEAARVDDGFDTPPKPKRRMRML